MSRPRDPSQPRPETLTDTRGTSDGVATQTLYKGYLLGFVGVCFFGLTLPFSRVSVAELDPWFLTMMRSLIAFFAAVVVLAVTRSPWPERRDWPLICAMALFIFFGFTFFSNYAMRYAPASHGGVVLALQPLFAVLTSMLIAGERPSLGFWLCCVAGTATVGLFALLSGAGNSQLHWADILLVTASMSTALGYPFAGILSRRLGAGWRAVSWGAVVAGPALFAAFLVFPQPINWGASTEAWLGVLYVGLFSQFIAISPGTRGSHWVGFPRSGRSNCCSRS
jgi:drug/metabolite transporter (DMT)-like permease